MSDPEIQPVEIGEESSQNFPPKPEFSEQAPNIQGSIISLVIFIGIFLLLGMELRMVFIILLVLLFHELGHFVAMKQFGYKNVNMFFVPLFGAFVSGEKEEASEKQSVVTILAGPVPGIILGLILLYLEFSLGFNQLDRLPEVFLSLNILNLLPLLPLDGGRLIETLFTKGKVVLENFFLILSALLVIGLSWMLNSIPALIIAAFILLQLRKNFKNQKMRRWFSEERLSLQVSYARLTDSDFWRMDALLRNRVPELAMAPASITAIMIRNLLMPQPAQKLNWPSRLGIVVFWLLCLLIPVWIYMQIHWAEFSQFGGSAEISA
jgi:stage IV sporulation protein FB